MRCPTVKQLTAAFRNLQPEAAHIIRRLARQVDDPAQLQAHVERAHPETARYVRQMHASPYDSAMWRRTVVLHAINHLLNTYGVEPLGPVSMREGPPYEYCNTGDTYAITLVYQRKHDRLILASWGDIAERDPLCAGEVR